MWKHFIPRSFRITREQQSVIENFIDIGDAFIQNLDKFSRLEKDFKHNLDLLLSEQRKREKHKREQAKLKKLREYEKKRDEEEKVKEENIRKGKEENERKELEEREKIRQES